MIDREKVIKGLETHLNRTCELCPYEEGFNCIDPLLCDALALLKAQDQEAQRDYEAAVEMAEYCECYEPTYNPEDGSM